MQLFSTVGDRVASLTIRRPNRIIAVWGADPNRVVD
jgi:hypothetical protein